MTLNEYVIGIVMPYGGINPAQLAKIVSNIKFTERALGGESWTIKLRVVALRLRRPEDLPQQIIKQLQYKVRVKIEPLPKYHDSKDGPTIPFLYQSLKDCDEVWCCLGINQATSSTRRSSAVFNYAQNQADFGIARKFKMLPGWVEYPADEQKPNQKAKKEKAWNGRS